MTVQYIVAIMVDIPMCSILIGTIDIDQSPFTVVEFQVTPNCRIVTESGPILHRNEVVGSFRANANVLVFNSMMNFHIQGLSYF